MHLMRSTVSVSEGMPYTFPSVRVRRARAGVKGGLLGGFIECFIRVFIRGFIRGLGFRDQGLRFKFRDLGFGLEGLESGFWVTGLRYEG